ncbi:unnamed protein product [Trichogramma brassicae]|uniref:Reverse transcriptase zinc-binding domain-containing protein n=1 Tax=Trichogramma brassicae TaxID=86971 RepID=A0A6H5IG44_9HYME|nr:unnamed protein product [Trichogramma brassicae]
MPNTGGPRSSRRELYARVVDSILLYGAPIWRCATETEAYIRQAEAVHRRACLRVISGRPHVSYDATYVIAGVPPLALLADERARIYQRRPEEVKEEERRETLRRWQDRWDRAPKGRWTHRLIPKNAEWVERGHGEVGYYLTQLLSGHGYFKSHSQRYDNTLSALCPACPNTIENAEHVFFRCPRFQEERERLQQVLQEEIEPENITRLMLMSAGKWLAVASFAQSVVTRLRQEAQRSKKIIRTMLRRFEHNTCVLRSFINWETIFVEIEGQSLNCQSNQPLDNRIDSSRRAACHLYHADAVHHREGLRRRRRRRGRPAKSRVARLSPFGCHKPISYTCGTRVSASRIRDRSCNWEIPRLHHAVINRAWPTGKWNSLCEYEWSEGRESFWRNAGTACMQAFRHFGREAANISEIKYVKRSIATKWRTKGMLTPGLRPQRRLACGYRKMARIFHLSSSSKDEVGVRAITETDSTSSRYRARFRLCAEIRD